MHYILLLSLAQKGYFEFEYVRALRIVPGPEETLDLTLDFKPQGESNTLCGLLIDSFKTA